MARIALIITIIGVAIAAIIGVTQIVIQIGGNKSANENSALIQNMMNKINENEHKITINNYNFITINLNDFNRNFPGFRTNADYLKLVIDTLLAGNQLEEQQQTIFKIKEILNQAGEIRERDDQFFFELDREISNINGQIAGLSDKVIKLQKEWAYYFNNPKNKPAFPAIEKTEPSIEPRTLEKPEFNLPLPSIPKKKNHWYYLITNPRRFWDRDHPNYQLDLIKLNEIKPIVIPNLEMNHSSKDNCTGEQVNGNNTPVGKNSYSN
ncbi:MAG: hypothetical protein GX444_12785 [Myxococcales bacterium]|nr:hypothetical protein [Myxococcales bacterium]